MATDQEDSKSASASHPPYSEMIMTVITEMGEKDGSSKQAISKQIEATFGDSLQPDHSVVLSEAMTKLKDSGKLLLVNNKYLKPDTSAQPRRGRGRPAKPKPDLPEEAELPLPKQKVPASASASTGKKRGRPAKNSKRNDDSEPPPAGPKRGRGRPPKASSSTADASAE